MRNGILTVLLLLPLLVFTQNRLYIGAEFGPKFEDYEAVGTGTGLYAPSFFWSPIFGINLGYDIGKNFSLETGILFNDYGESFRIRGDLAYGMSNAIMCYQIPLRLRSHIPIIRERLYLTATLGYSIAINQDYQASGFGRTFSSGSIPGYNDSTRTESESTYSFRRVFGLVETGLGVSYRFRNGIALSLSANYFMGLSRVVEVDVKYWVNDGPMQTGTVFSNGNYSSFTLGASYAINRLWRKKDLQIQ